MSRRIAVLDTDFLLVYLEVPGFKTAGAMPNQLNKSMVDQQLGFYLDQTASIVLPFAVIVETGNHIVNAKHSVRETAIRFVEILQACISDFTPYIAFDDTPSSDTISLLKRLISN